MALLRGGKAAAPVVNLGVRSGKAMPHRIPYRQGEAGGPRGAVALGERLMKEPFEIGADITLSSDDLPAELGLPLTRLLLGVDIKYDMRFGRETARAGDGVLQRVSDWDESLCACAFRRIQHAAGRAGRYGPFTEHGAWVAGDELCAADDRDEVFTGVLLTWRRRLCRQMPPSLRSYPGAGRRRKSHPELDEAAMQSVLAGMGELLKEDAALRGLRNILKDG